MRRGGLLAEVAIVEASVPCGGKKRRVVGAGGIDCILFSNES